jgi:hypothetical protein
MHKPTEPAAITAAIRNMHRTGLKARDIAATMRVDLSVALQALREDSTCARTVA